MIFEVREVGLTRRGSPTCRQRRDGEQRERKNCRLMIFEVAKVRRKALINQGVGRCGAGRDQLRGGTKVIAA